jgi:YgiT-type zinc finger domain-containing protein
MGSWLQGKEGKMKCIHCSGKMKKGTTPLHIDKVGCHVTIDKAPAWLCTQCGESYFEENEVNIIQDIIAVVEKKTQKLLLSA